MKKSVSIILCTRNRAEYLSLTLESLAGVRLPKGFETELLVVDNASTDETSGVVAAARIPQMTVRYHYEPRAGKSVALNNAIARAQGDLLLFTDDDILVPRDWIQGLCEPILRGEAHAVCGAVRIPPHLNLPWMDNYHRGWLASTEDFRESDINNMVGGNMAFTHEVLEQVPALDPQLGAGMRGYHEESLFTWQLRLAGYRVKYLPHVVAEHHFSKSRLNRKSMLNIADKAGRSSAYVAHHWEHREIKHPRAKMLRALLRLAYWRLRRHGLRTPRDNDGAPRWEMEMAMDVAYHKQYLTERRQRRNYRPYALRLSSQEKGTPPDRKEFSQDVPHPIRFIHR